MTVHMAWSWDVDGMAGADFESVEDAVTALVGSVRRQITRYGTQQQADIMINCVAPVRAAMRMEGAEALRAGKSWSTTCGGLFVALSPKP